ncbi:MAG TPA: HBL/NHE enterotoxin family protein [Leptolyngbyaceae cyanobacterium]
MAIHLSKVTNNPLVPRYIKDDISKTVAALVLIKTYSKRIVEQPELHLKISDNYASFRNFSDYQTTFKQHAYYLLNCLTPSLISVASDLIDYAEMFQCFYYETQSIVPFLGKKNEAKERFVDLLDRLEKEAEKSKSNAQAMAAILQEFKSEIQSDNDKFRAELKVVNQNFDAAIEELTAFPATIPMPSSNPPKIPIISSGSQTFANIIASLADYLNQLQEPYQKITLIYTNTCLLNQVTEDFESLFETTCYICEAHKAITTEWLSILANLKSFKREISNASHNLNTVQIESNLKLANSEWDTISQKTQEMVVRVLSIKPEEMNTALN